MKNIKNSYPLKTLTLDCQKTMMRELLMDKKMITSSDFKQPYVEYFKYNPEGTSIENGNVIIGQFGAYKNNEFIRQLDDFDYQLKYPIVFETDNNEKIENMIGKVYFRPVPQNDYKNNKKEFVVEEVKLTKKYNKYFWGDEECHSSWLIEPAVVFFDTVEECQHKCNQFNYEKGYVTITIDNLHLYYQFMSDEDKFQLSHYKNGSLNFIDIFKKRTDYIIDVLKLSTSDFFNEFKKICFDIKDDFNEYTIGLSCFGIIDTLKPIDEYIEDIKKSDAYKTYMAKDL